MDRELLLKRLKVIKDEFEALGERLEALDGIMADGSTEEAVKKYAEELTIILAEREPLVREVQKLVQEVGNLEKEAPDNPPDPLKGGRDGGALVI